MVESNDHRSTSPAGFFRVPGLFVRLSSKGLNHGMDPDSVWSPTSPLDFKNLRSSPRRVGLGLVDALTADASSLRFGCKSSFLDSIRPFLELALPKSAAACGKAGSAVGGATTLDEVAVHAESEEYTCVIARGANPRTTHILGGGEMLEVREGAVTGGCGKAIFSIAPFSDHPSPSARAGVASGRCGCCMKRLQEDRDVYMYLGEKAFCSSECRKGYIEEEIEVEELMMLDSALDH